MTDIVNDYFKRFYPADHANTIPEYCVRSYARRYQGESGKTIFDEMVCADGLRLSVQGHFGAYSMPRDDFADHYHQVEIMGPKKADELLAPFERDCNSVGDEMIYPYVPVEVVAAVIAKHGGLAGPVAP